MLVKFCGITVCTLEGTVIKTTRFYRVTDILGCIHGDVHMDDSIGTQSTSLINKATGNARLGITRNMSLEKFLRVSCSVLHDLDPVSYTHLTLPTILRV